MNIQNINKKLQVIQNYYNYLGSILTRGYNNNIHELDNIYDNIKQNESFENDDSDESSEEESEDDQLFGMKKTQSTFSTKKSNFCTPEEEDEELEEMDSDKIEETESDDSNDPTDEELEIKFNKQKSNILQFITKKSNVNEKVLEFINKPINTSDIFLYKTTSKYNKRLNKYVDLIKSY